MSAPERTLRVCVVQLALAVGEVERNLRHAADVATRAAREHEPDLLLLPDAIGSPIVYDDAMLGVARQVDGEPYELLRRLAREHGCWVGGGFLAVRGRDARSTYVLADPAGGTHVHDKDQPDMWEACYATGAGDDGFASTPLGPIGIVSGMEWLRTRTAARLAGYVDLVVGGSCSWSYPDLPLVRAWTVRREHSYAVALTREAPARMARLVGAPAAVARQVGGVRGRTPLASRIAWRTTLVGESQVVERDGHVLARLAYEDGEGYVAADVRLAEPKPLDPLPKTFWLPVLPLSMHVGWLHQGLHGRLSYARRRRTGGFPWQAWPRHQLYAYNPPDVPPHERAERQIVADPFGADPLPEPAPSTGR